MLKKKFFKKKPKPAEKKVDVRSKKAQIPVPPTTCTSDTKNVYEYVDPEYSFGPSGYTPLSDNKALPKPPERNAASGKTFSKDAILDLPLQRVLSNRRIDDLDEAEYGYTSFGKVHQPKKKDTSWEEEFLDAYEFLPYQKVSHSPAISKFFFTPQEKYERLSVEEVCRKFDNASTEIQQDMMKYITSCLLPSLKHNDQIIEVFSLLSCKSKFVRSLCIYELTKLIMEGDQRKYSKDCMLKLYETGTVQLFTVIGETKKSFSIFQSLIQLGVIFNCFIYLRAIEAVDDWIACIRNVKSAIQSKHKRVAQRADQDVQVFAKTAYCIFNLEEVDFDESLLMGEDMNTFLPVFKREESTIYIDGMAALFHTGNLMMRQQSKFTLGVQKLAVASVYMNDSNDEGIKKWYHRVLGLFIVHLLEQEHPGVKQETLEKCEDELLSILGCKYFHPKSFCVSKSLLFHHNERIRTKYRGIHETREKGDTTSKYVTEDHMQTLLNKCDLVLDRTTSESPTNYFYQRKQCTVYTTEATITCIAEDSQNNSRDVTTYGNTLPFNKDSVNQDRKERLKNELEVLKEIESKEIHRNVARLLAFNPSFPPFYIKERLPGDNLQRRLLAARDKRDIIPITDLISIIVQAVQAVIYVHSCGCLIRDITTASYGCTKIDNEYFIKLKNFEMAAKPSDFPSGGIVTGLIDLDFEGVPIRWAAPESLLDGNYSIYSDVWSVNILADEILNYAAWPYSDISDSDIDDMVTNIVFTHLKPQGFNRPRRVQGLILEGLASKPEERLKLEALRERLLDISDNLGDAQSCCSVYDTYSGIEGTHAKVYDIPPLTERQIKANSKFARGIPKSIRKYRELSEDPEIVFASEIAENNTIQRKKIGVKETELSSVEYYKIESEDRTNMMRVSEKVSDDFLKFTYNRLKEIDSSKLCVEPWPPAKSVSANGSKQLHYKFPKSTHLLDLTLHKERGESIGPYLELLYELANHVDSFHSAGWIIRCLRAKNVWILETKKGKQTIVVPKFGKYLVIQSSEFDTHLEQIKVEGLPTDGIHWLPIEAIKAGLYSKESDVYAFGMITWEVMTAFGEQGVVYDQDEELELTCMPFSYQRSEDILQHLIEGYIPEKPIKCPDWFYLEVTRPCLLHQKIDRPSMKIIRQILETRLGKTPPRQDRFLPPRPGQHKSDSMEDYDDVMYEDIDLPSRPRFPSTEIQEDGTKESGEISCKVLPLPKLPPKILNRDGSETGDFRETNASTAPTKNQVGQNITCQISEEQNSENINSAKRNLQIPIDTKVAADAGSNGSENTENIRKTRKAKIPLSSLPPIPKSRVQKRDRDVSPSTHSPSRPKNQPRNAGYSRTSESDARKPSVDYMNKSSDPSLHDIYRGSDFYETKEYTSSLKVTEHLTESFQKLGTKTHHVDVDSRDIEKGSDFFGKLSTVTANLPNPKNKNEFKSAQYDNQGRYHEEDTMSDKMRKGVENQRSPIYVNNSPTERKPVVPPRKPLK